MMSIYGMRIFFLSEIHFVNIIIINIGIESSYYIIFFKGKTSIYIYYIRSSHHIILCYLDCVAINNKYFFLNLRVKYIIR